MAAGRAALLAAGIGGLVVAAPTNGWARSLSGPACTPDVAVTGTPREAAALRRALVRMGGGQAAEPAACHPWRVIVWRAGSHLMVEIGDGEGVSVVRRVGGTDVAAALVDSWRHRDVREVEAPPPAGAVVAAAPPASPAPVAPAPAAAADVLRSPPAAPPLRAATTTTKVLVVAGPDISVASDGSLWAGGHAGACLSLGRACTGVVARVDATRAVVGDPGTTRRYTADVLASVAVPLAIRPFTLVPTLGVGAGLLQANTADPGSPPGERSGARESTTFGLRTATGIALVIPLGARFGVDLGGSVDVSLPARGPASDGQGGTYPAEPRFFVRGGLALRYGTPP